MSFFIGVLVGGFGLLAVTAGVRVFMEWLEEEDDEWWTS